MVNVLWKSRSQSIERPLADEASAVELVDYVAQKMLDGFHKAEIITELMRQHWSKKAATQFCAEVSKIVHELYQLPDQRAAFVKRSQEQMQAGLGWIGSGVAAWLVVWSTGSPSTKKMAFYILLAPLFGVFEFASGFIRWFPHRDFQHPAEVATKGKQASIRKS